MSEEQLREQIQELRARVDRGEVHLKRNREWLKKIEDLLRSLDVSLRKLVQLEESHTHLVADHQRLEKILELEVKARAEEQKETNRILTTLCSQGASTDRWSRFTEGMLEKALAPLISSAVIGGILYLALAKDLL